MSELNATVATYDRQTGVIKKVYNDREGILTAGQGIIQPLQVLAKVSGKYVKYVSGASDGTEIIHTLYAEDVASDDSTSADKDILVLTSPCWLNAAEVVGIDYVTDKVATPAAPTLTIQAGGTLDATTLHTYKVTGVADDGMLTVPGSTAGATTLAVAAGYVQGLQVANIAAVNAVLGDCSGTPKTVIFTVDGVTHSKTFSADYSGAGALANHAALISALDTASSTVTSSDGAKIKIASDTTGAASIVTIVSDTTGLFAAPVTVAGVALSKTIKVSVAAVPAASGYKLWRTADGGTTWKWRRMTEAEVLLGYIVDDGSLTWTTGTPLTSSDNTAISALEKLGFYLEGVR